MKKLLLAIMLLSVGAVGFGKLHQAAGRDRRNLASRAGEWRAATTRQVDVEGMAASLRDEVADKRNRLKLLPPNPNISPQMLELLKGETIQGPAAAWAELREQLAIGWNSSDDYVLVSKRLVKQLNLHPFDQTTRAVLAISPREEAGIQAAIGRAKASPLCQVQRIEPVGDVVAHYTIQEDAMMEQSISNNFSADITATLGSERAGVSLGPGWRDVRDHLGSPGQEPTTITIRRVEADGDSKLVCQLDRGDTVSRMDVHYGHYPAGWFLTLFPGGWQAIAQREGFELPKNFKN